MDAMHAFVVAGPQVLARVISRASGGEVIAAVRTREPVVALTVDDGPHPATTPPLLDVLDAAGAAATFFLLGARVADHPDLPARIAAAGHELGNHLHRDEPSALLSPEEFARQLTDVHALLSAHGPVQFWRPGSGWFTPAMLRAGRTLGYRCALGSPGLAVATYSDPDAVAQRLARLARPGAVVVLHEGSPERAAVVPVVECLLAALARRGLRAVTLDTLIASSR